MIRKVYLVALRLNHILHKSASGPVNIPWKFQDDGPGVWEEMHCA